MTGIDPAALALPAKYDATRGLSPEAILELDQGRAYWISKRYDRFRLLEDSTIERRVELHVDLRTSNLKISPLVSSDAIDQQTVATGRESNESRNSRGTLLLPLMRLDRRSFADVEVHCPAGEVIARPSSGLERLVVAEAIAALASRIQSTPGLHKELVKCLIPILEQSPSGARIITNAGSTDVRIARKVVNVLASYLGLQEPVAPEKMTALHRWLRSSGIDLRSCVEIANLTEVYEDKKLLLACFPSSVLYEPTVVHVVHREQLPRRPIPSRIRRLALGTTSLGAIVGVKGIDEAGTYHAIAQAPPGFRVVDVAMEVREEFADNEVVVSRSHWHYDDDPLSTQSHVECSRSNDADFSEGTLFLAFFSDNTGTFIGGFVAAILGLMVFTFFGFVVGLDREGLQQFGDASKADIVAAVLFLVPSIAVGFVVSSEGDKAVRQAFAHTNYFLFLLAISCAVASLPLVVDFDFVDPAKLWSVALLAGAASSTRIILASFVHIWRISNSRMQLRQLRRSLSP